MTTRAVSSNVGPGSHLGVAVFDSDPADQLPGTQDPDLLVGTGNILILQNDDSSAFTNDPSVGKVYDFPNDEATYDDRGSIIFDFLQVQTLLSIDLVDVNGGVNMDLTLTDLIGNQRMYHVPERWTTDVTQNLAGYQTLNLQTLLPQASEPLATGGDATATQDPLFDPSQVIRLEVAIGGNSPSGGIDTLVIAPEPSTVLLLGLGFLALAANGRRSSRR